MPKLSSDTAAKVEEVESTDFVAIPEGIYTAVLDGEVEAAEGPKGLYWKWTFKLTDEDFKGRKMFTNTSLNESAMWKLKEVFSAFGVSADTDTDELIGKSVKLYIVQRIIEKGARVGEMGNEVRQVLPLDDSAKADTTKPGKKKSGKDDSLALF